MGFRIPGPAGLISIEEAMGGHVAAFVNGGREQNPSSPGTENKSRSSSSIPSFDFGSLGSWIDLCAAIGMEDAYILMLAGKASHTNISQTPHSQSQSISSVVEQQAELYTVAASKLKMSTVLRILEGDSDLRVPRVLVVIDKVIVDGTSVILHLYDPTGAMVRGFTSTRVLKEFPGLANPGSSLVLENVAVFVNKNPFERVLSVHGDTIKAIFE